MQQNTAWGPEGRDDDDDTVNNMVADMVDMVDDMVYMVDDMVDMVDNK